MSTDECVIDDGDAKLEIWFPEVGGWVWKEIISGELAKKGKFEVSYKMYMQYERAMI